MCYMRIMKNSWRQSVLLDMWKSFAGRNGAVNPTSALHLSQFRLVLLSNKRRLFHAATAGITVAEGLAGRHAAMMYHMFRRSLMVAAMTLGSLFAALALEKKRKNLLAVAGTDRSLEAKGLWLNYAVANIIT